MGFKSKLVVYCHPQIVVSVVLKFKQALADFSTTSTVVILQTGTCLSDTF